MVYLEGDALAWYYYEETRRTSKGWSEFKKSLLERFRSSHMGEHDGATSSTSTDILHG